LRVYEWAIYQQLNGLELIAVTPEEASNLKLSPGHEALDNLIKPSEIELARKYFLRPRDPLTHWNGGHGGPPHFSTKLAISQ
jgi:hypothetical protein